jgi:hypothetical protein
MEKRLLFSKWTAVLSVKSAFTRPRSRYEGNITQEFFGWFLTLHCPRIWEDTSHS